MTDIITTVLGFVLIALIMGKAAVSALAHLIAWVMTRLAEKGYFSIVRGPTYEEFYAAHCGDLDIEH